MQRLRRPFGHWPTEQTWTYARRRVLGSARALGVGAAQRMRAALLLGRPHPARAGRVVASPALARPGRTVCVHLRFAGFADSRSDIKCRQEPKIGPKHPIGKLGRAAAGSLKRARLLESVGSEKGWQTSLCAGCQTLTHSRHTLWSNDQRVPLIRLQRRIRPLPRPDSVVCRRWSRSPAFGPDRCGSRRRFRCGAPSSSGSVTTKGERRWQ